MDEIEQKDVDLENNEEELEIETAGEEVKEAPKKEYTTEQKLARVERQRARYMRELGLEDKPPVEKKVDPVKTESKGNTGESDVEALLLEVKGITEPEEVSLFEKWKADTGRSAREILKNDVFQKELKAIKDEKAVKAATPSSTKRSGGGETNTFELDLAKYEQTGELPDDFARRAAVINAKVEAENTNKPAWH